MNEKTISLMMAALVAGAISVMMPLSSAHAEATSRVIRTSGHDNSPTLARARMDRHLVAHNQAAARRGGTCYRIVQRLRRITRRDGVEKWESRQLLRCHYQF